MSFKDLSSKITSPPKGAANDEPKPAPASGAPSKALAGDAPAPNAPKKS